MLPQIIGLRRISDEKFQLVIKGGLIDISDEFWTTEKLADKLFYCLAKKQSEPELATIPAANNNNCHKDVDLLEQYESKNTLLYRKYIIRAEKLACSYLEYKPNIFVINLSDLDERLQAELIDLMAANSKRTLSHILHSAVARIFALTSLAWFYESARNEIEVILEP